MSEPQAPPQTVSGKLPGLAQALLQYARARLDLLQHEWRQEQTRVLGQLARAAIFALGALITLQLICAFVLIAFWDTPWRLAAAGVLVLLFGGVTWIAWRGMQRKGDDDRPAFGNTLAEFDKDREIFERLAELRDPAKKPDERGHHNGSSNSTGRDAIVPMSPPIKSNGASTPAASGS